MDTKRVHYVTDSRVSLCWFLPSNPKPGSFCSVEAEAEWEERKRIRKGKGEKSKGEAGRNEIKGEEGNKCEKVKWGEMVPPLPSRKWNRLPRR